MLLQDVLVIGTTGHLAVLETTHALSGQRLLGTAGDRDRQQLLTRGQSCYPEARGPAALPPGGPHGVILTKLCAPFRLMCLRSLNCPFFFFFFYFLAAPLGMQNPSSPIRDGTFSCCSGSTESQLLGHQGSPWVFKLCQTPSPRSSDLLTPELSW